MLWQMVKRISTLICQVSDMDQSVAFYRDQLGLTPGMVSQWWSTFPIGDSQLGLHPPMSDAPRGAGWVLGIEVDDLVGLRTHLEAGGVTCAPYHDIPGGCVMDFTDPDGHAIQAMQVGVTSQDLS
jgi:predicted enzyme related to lactoylglutathione lyase